MDTSRSEQGRRLSILDALIQNVDQGLRTLAGCPATTGRADPDEGVPEATLGDDERGLSAGLMRVNHAGEVCAQALYQGQALTARGSEVRGKLEQAAREENDHLAWCARRVTELGGHTSYLNPLWYAGSLVVGALAGLVGDRWSLGFLAETEHQVMAHLDGHLARLPETDERSRAILLQMKEDEGHHATVALESGGVSLPDPVRRLMATVSRVMTTVAYRV
jgi:ubiquinone biosynthesis monooxygenase Coq7